MLPNFLSEAQENSDAKNKTLNFVAFALIWLAWKSSGDS